MLELPFRPAPDSREPVYRQLLAYLSELIESGQLVPGEKLPATRDLAIELDLSRNTVSHAYELLVDARLATAHVGQGTFVSARSERGPATRRPAAPLAPPDETPELAWDELLSRRARNLKRPRALSRFPGPPPEFDFLGGRIDASALPVGELRRAWSRAVGNQLRNVVNVSQPYGWPDLREQIARFLVARGVACAADEVLVVSGAQQALDLLARTLVDPGDWVALEEPGYFGAQMAFRGCDARLAPVAVDDGGLRIDALARVLATRRVKLLYTTPAAQCPTGAVLAEERREALLALAAEHQVAVIEDDYDSELRFGTPALPALKTRDRAGAVVYLGTFSKALFPGLRLGYVVAPPRLLARLALSRFGSDFGSDALSQAAVADLIESGGLERHVRKVRRLYGRRREAMLEALAQWMPEGTRWTRPSGGHAVWLELPGSVDPDALGRAAAAAGIAYAPGENFSLTRRGRHCIYLSFVNQPRARIREGIARLSGLVAEELGASPRAAG